MAYPKTEIELKNFISDTLNNYNGHLRMGSGVLSSVSSRITHNQISLSPGSNIQKAVDTIAASGGGVVFLQDGTYLMNNDINLSSNVLLQGETPIGVVIDFQNQPYGIRLKGTNTYTTGTVSATVGGTSVYGSGTTWTQSMVGQNIFLGGLWYNIVTVNSTNLITLDQQYTATGISGNLVNGGYIICTVISGCILSNFTVQNSSDKAIDIENATNMVLEFLTAYTSNYGLYVYNSGGLLVDNGFIYSCNYGAYFYNSTSTTFQTTSSYNIVIGDGIRFDNSGDSSIFNFACSNCSGNGVSFNNSFNTDVIAGTINDNSGNGVELIAGNNSIFISQTTTSGNTGSGFKITGTSNNNSINNNISTLNGQYGVNVVNANCSTNIVVSNNLFSNSAGQMNNSGTNTKIKSNIGVADGA